MITRLPSLADQVKLDLLSSIRKGTLADRNGRLPSEAALAENYGVSRATIRDALAQLALVGIIVRRHGSGNYLTQSTKWDLDSFWGWLDVSPAFLELIEIMGFEPSFRSISSSICESDAAAHELGFPELSPCYCFDRLFLASEKPLIHSKTVVPLDIIKSVDAHELVKQQAPTPGSVYEFIENCCGAVVDHQICEIRSVSATHELSTLLACQKESPLLRLDEVGYNIEQKPLFMAINHFRGDVVSFRQLRHPGLSIKSP
jgi:GntR family transcriptional regulator